jgi:hypothetical protein
VGEYTPEDVREGAEFAIADGIIDLAGREEAEKHKRVLRVLKMRGSGHDTSLHEILIDAPHLAVGPRLAAVDLPGAAPATWPKATPRSVGAAHARAKPSWRGRSPGSGRGL